MSDFLGQKCVTIIRKIHLKLTMMTIIKTNITPLSAMENIQDLILDNLEAIHMAEADKIRKQCQDNCQVVGGQWFDDICDLTLGRDAVAIFVDPLDLILFFDTVEQYEKYAALEKSMQYDRQRLLAPINQIIYYKDTRVSLIISRYEPVQLADFMAKELGCPANITRYDALRHIVSPNKQFDNFEQLIRAMDPLARGPKRMVSYQYRLERKARVEAYKYYESLKK
jgi:hypothetical protein